MRLKPSTKFHIKNAVNATVIYYTVMLAIIAVSFVAYALVGGNSNFGGISPSSIIFLFVIGICLFSEEFNMLMQNGISRTEVLRSFFVSGIIISAAMSAIDLVLYAISAWVTDPSPLIMMISAEYVSNDALNIINTYFLQVLIYTLALTFGHFIRLVYYRMSKTLTIIVSVTMPLFLFIVLPVLSAFFRFIPSLTAVFVFLERVMDPSKFYGLPMVYIFFAVLILITMVFNKLLIKKAVVK